MAAKRDARRRLTEAMSAKRRADALRQQAVLIELATAGSGELDDLVDRALVAEASALGVERVSFWRFEVDSAVLQRVAQHKRTGGPFGGPVEVHQRDCPKYFDALRRDFVISTNDAPNDPRLAELRESYLVPEGITAMLDVPVWVNQELAGVICHEHVKSARLWTSEEEAFAMSVGLLVSTALENDARRQVERDLWGSEEQLRLFQSSATDYTLVRLDPEGTICAGAELIRGHRAAEVRGEHFSIFYRPEEVTQGLPERALKQALDTGRFDDEQWLVRRDGSKFWARVIILPLHEQSGRLRGFVQITRDLTAERLAKENQELLEQTRRGEARARLLSDVSAALGSTLNAEQNLDALGSVLDAGVADGIVFHHEHFEDGRLRLKPLVIQDALPGGKLYLDAWAERCGGEEGCPDPVRQVLQSRRAQLLKDPAGIDGPGAHGYGSVIVAPSFARDRMVGLLSLFRRGPVAYGPEDQALAEELAQRIGVAVDNSRLYRLAREAVGLRDVFLSVAAHELRTPIAALQLALQSWKRERDRHMTSPDIEERKLGLALRQARRLGTLVTELLEVSRIGNNLQTLEVARTDLSTLVTDVAATLNDEAVRAGCELRLHVQEEVTGMWDAARTEQVITNLLANAFKFGAGKPVEVTVRAEGEYAVVSVRDHGIGISEKDRARIFGRFERAVSEKNFGGMGLGLYIVQELVEAHHGSVSVQSQPGEGSTFTVTLPRFASAGASPQALH